MTLTEVIIAIFDLKYMPCNIFALIITTRNVKTWGHQAFNYIIFLVTCCCNFRETADDALKIGKEESR